MRIALISREYPPETGWGGIGTYVYALAHALGVRGHEVHVISRSDRQQEYLRSDGQVSVHRIRERKWRGPLSDLLCQALPVSNWCYSRRVAEKVRELHAREPFDIIEAPEYKAEAFHLVRRPPTPVVVKLHTPTYLLEQLNGNPRSFRETCVKWMERTAARRAHRLSSPSQSLARLVGEAWRVHGEQIHVLPYPIGLSQWPKQPWSATGPMALFVGRFESRKGVQILIEALPRVLERVPEARFVFVGGHVEGRKDAEQFARQLTERIHRLGCRNHVRIVPWQDHEALLRYYRESSVVVVPSLYDNYPNVCLEAMATGRPVVGSRVGGIPEIVSDGVTGWLVPPADAHSLAEVLGDVLGDPARAAQAGEAARTFVETQLAPQRIAGEAVAFYQEVIDQARSVSLPMRAPSGGTVRAQPRASLHVLYTTTERWVDFLQPEGVPVHLAHRHSHLETQGLRVSWARHQRLMPPVRAHTGLADAVDKFWEVVSTLADALHVARQAAPIMRAVDVVHEWYSLYGVSGLLLARRYRKPLVFEVDALLMEEYTALHRLQLGRWRTWWARNIFRANVRHAARVIVRSQVMARVLQEQWGVVPSKIVVVPCGVDLGQFERLPAKREPSIPRIVFLGSLQPWHGCEVLLTAFAELLKRGLRAQLVVIGDGKQRPILIRRAAQLGLNGHVTFQGAVPHEQVPGMLRAATIAVAPYPELAVPFYFSPIKLFEYLGAGTAIVASRIGQLAEVLTDQETALLVEPGNVSQLAEAMVTLLHDPTLRERMGQRAAELAKRFTYQRQAAQVVEVYQQVAATPR